ncbi:MAG: hypothetical protein Q4F00_05355 [bacterium]|nr:hypothetical protein [bacterium]
MKAFGSWMRRIGCLTLRLLRQYFFYHLHEAGRKGQGGRIAACGAAEEIKSCRESVTGRYL